MSLYNRIRAGNYEIVKRQIMENAFKLKYTDQFYALEMALPEIEIPLTKTQSMRIPVDGDQIPNRSIERDKYKTIPEILQEIFNDPNNYPDAIPKFEWTIRSPAEQAEYEREQQLEHTKEMLIGLKQQCIDYSKQQEELEQQLELYTKRIQEKATKIEELRRNNKQGILGRFKNYFKGVSE